MNDREQNGSGVVEIVVAVAIISIVFFAVYQFAFVSTTSVHASVRQVEAAYLAQEGIEIARLSRDESWDEYIAPLAANTPYYPVIADDTWVLSTTDPGPIDSLFTRTVTFQDVLRDSDDNIAQSGTVDPDTKKVTATVSWSEKNGIREVVLETYLTNFLAN